MVEINSYNSDILSVFSQNLPWEKLSGSNILITGATGLIGSCLTETLLQKPTRDYSIYISARNIEKAKKRFANFLKYKEFHIIQYDVVERLESDVNFDFIIHTASYASPYFFVNNPVEVVKANINGVSNLIEYGKVHGLKRFLYISSGEIYGEGNGNVFTEEYSGYVNCATPRACYPSSKRAAETLCVSYAEEYGIDTVIARPCHIYGPNFTENDNRVYAQFIRNVLNGEDIMMKSDGSQYRSWCYVVDCVSAILYILLKGENKQPYNIADDNSNITIKELAEMIANIAGRNVVIQLPSDVEKAGYNVVKKSVFSTSKLQALGWKPLPQNMRTKMMSTINEQKLVG
jgi:nucleoside-diphosphate-sugar epimerase